MTLPGDPGKLAFLDGYLFRVMVDILKSEGPETSGFYDFYRARVEEVGSALSEYDRALVSYIATRFDRQCRRIVHAGTGLGTLPSALALAGYTVAGVEQDATRFRTAGRLRDALTDAWPGTAERYELIRGEFPSVISRTPWMTPKTILIFTNCGATWSDQLTESIISSFKSCGDVILDARLFGSVRESPEDRQSLLDRIGAQGLAIAPIAETPRGAHYYHLKPAAEAP